MSFLSEWYYLSIKHLNWDVETRVPSIYEPLCLASFLPSFNSIIIQKRNSDWIQTQQMCAAHTEKALTRSRSPSVHIFTVLIRHMEWYF